MSKAHTEFLRSKHYHYFLVLFLLCSAIFVLGLRFCHYFGPAPLVTTYNPTEISDGYILISPVAISEMNESSGTVLLLDSAGRTVHTWHTKYPVMNANLEPEGTLYVSLVRPQKFNAYPSFGTTGIIQTLDWNSNVTWEYELPSMTHDFDVLSDGSIAVLAWDATPKWFADSIVGGYKTSSSTSWSTSLRIIGTDKKEKWVWHAYEHLNPWEYPLLPSLPRSDWMHANSVEYVSVNPITNKPAFLLSARNISRVFLIDPETGNVIWQSPRDTTSLQHDATLLANGNILLFDNGVYNSITRGSTILSRVLEIEPKNDSITWEYHGDNTPTSRTAFASSVMGGAQRLSNGNTLITLSTQGRILEVTKEGVIVFEYVLPFISHTTSSTEAVFKARKYDSTNTAWSHKLIQIPTIHAICNVK